MVRSPSFLLLLTAAALVLSCEPDAVVEIDDFTDEILADSGQGLALASGADAYVRSNSSANFGAASSVRADQNDSNDTLIGYIRFPIGNVGTISKATLRVVVTNKSANAADIIKIADTTWSESALSWANRPSIAGTLVKSLTSAGSGLLEVDVTNFVTPNSVLSLAIVPRSQDGFAFSSKESSTNKPQLELITAAMCTPKSCSQLNATCGSISDGCGGMLSCGSCTSPDTCGGAGIANQCGHSTVCTPKTCASASATCGSIPDGCGGTLSCGTCTSPDTCGGSGTPNTCGHTTVCVPKTCSGLGATCGSVSNGCGGMLSCGSCTSPDTCGGGGVANKCGHTTVCVPKTCSGLGATCGSVSDGCGGTLSCGTCASPLTCGGAGVANQCGQVVVPPPSSCLANTNISKVSGAFTSAYTGQPANGSTVDARSASWTLGDAWLATPKDSHNVCFYGGEFSLTVDDTTVSPTTAWANIWHHNGGFTLKYNNANWTFDSVYIHHVGDAFNLSDGAQDFTIRDSHIQDVRDDCVQNDRFHAGNVHHNFFDGCYVGFSARETAGVTPNDGHLNNWFVTDNLVWIKPMYSVYKGDSPGNGQLIKWEKSAPQYAPHLVFKNNIVRVGKTAFQVGSSGGEDFFFPAGMEFSNNVLVWDGAGPVPASLANMFNAAHNSRIGTMADWNAAVTAWKAAHPSVK